MKNPAKPTNKPGGKTTPPAPNTEPAPATNPENTAPTVHREPGGRFKKAPTLK